MSRWRFLLVYVPAAIACWGIGHLAGIKNGTGGSLAAGYGGGLVLTILIFLLRRRWRPAVRVERWRNEAIHLRLTNPALYNQILVQADSGARPAAERDPDAYVAMFLSFAAEAGFAPQDLEEDDSVVPAWPFEVLGLPYGAPPSDVKRAYRALAARFHPDHNADDSTASERFRAVQAAYEELGRP